MKWFCYSKEYWYVEHKARDRYEATLRLRGLFADPNIEEKDILPCMKEGEE